MTAAALGATLRLYRATEIPTSAGGKTKTPPPCVCGCGRRIRVAPPVLAAGRITCGICDTSQEGFVQRDGLFCTTGFPERVCTTGFPDRVGDVVAATQGVGMVGTQRPLPVGQDGLVQLDGPGQPPP